MKYLFTLATLLCLLTHRSLGAALDPVLDFCRQVSSDEEAIEQWTGVGVGPESVKPPGGYLFRFEYDLNGDGLKVLFLASSIRGEGVMGLWSIYSPDASSNYKKIASNVIGNPMHFHLMVSGTHRELQSIYMVPKYSVAAINRYIVSNENITYIQQKIEAKDIEKLNGPTRKEEFGIGDKLNVTVFKVLLSEYARNRSAAWRPYKPEFGLRDQNLDPADAPAIAANASFPVPTAKQLLGKP